LIEREEDDTDIWLCGFPS